MDLNSKQSVSILIFFTVIFSIPQWTNAQGKLFELFDKHHWVNRFSLKIVNIWSSEKGFLNAYPINVEPP